MAENLTITPDSSDPRVPIMVQLRVQGKTWGEVATALDLSTRHVWELRQEHGVDAIVTQVAQETFANSMSMLLHATNQAVATAVEVMSEDTSQCATVDEVAKVQSLRLKAAADVLRLSLKAGELSLLSAKPSARADKVSDAELIALVTEPEAGEG